MSLQKHLGKKIIDRIMSFSAAVDNLHKKHAPYLHCYLFFIGVDPAYQKKRVASRLITPMLGWLDMQKFPVISTPRTKRTSAFTNTMVSR